MSDLKLSLEEELPSPDLFSDPEIGTNISVAGTSDETSSTSAGYVEPDLTSDDPEWKGISMEEIYKHHGPFDWHHLPPIHPSPSHTILFELPLPNRGPPRPHPVQAVDKWNQDCVRMPHSVHSLYPIDPENEATGGFRRRWEVIQESLLQNFMSSHQLEASILSYNHKYAERWDFAALHYFFNEYIDEEEAKMCLGSLIPKIVQLALQLPDLITGPIPLLKRQRNTTISLSQLQVASLLANAFLCTFPRRNSTNPQSEYGSFPFINFNKLFSSFREERHSRSHAVMEKLKCIFHYFRRVTSKAPEGTITIQRRFVPKKSCPRWDKQHVKLPALHITSKGTIESQGAGLLQVDFANKYVGGGVLNYGCVQEEIRFVICPELMVTMLVTEALDDTEALIINGVERYSRYEGYSSSFKWAGDFTDETPRDSSGRLKTCIVAIDALYFKQPNVQFNMGNVIRELNKAYVGFSSEIVSNNMPAVATGNWGCGAFRGNPQLKVLVQLMAAAVAGRSMVYFTFGDTNLRDSVADMYWHLIRHDVDIGRLFALLSQYQETQPENRSDFYRFLYNRSKIKPLTHYFNADKKSPAKRPNQESKTPEEKLKFNFDFKKHACIAKLKEDELEEKIEKWLENVEEDRELLEEESQEAVKMEVEDESSETNDTNKTDTATESNKPASTANKKKKQTFGELFGEVEAVENAPKKKITNLDFLDKLLTAEPGPVENPLQKSVSMEIDIKMDKKEDKTPKSTPKLARTKKSLPSDKKDSQMKIHDFFKKKD
ncbi:poly(ADP-ribose) glycohydrolase [Nasonia vitripennis]|uniref:poly(ADP-ribose) glycohydrolase n=1 Tax=Nasonia vitripennis TaxID=7425 RepID=A0A7M7G6H2_NASVI|nr:poly(ADP-ribose) glycohydrolase [Nasonia vitripennis]